MPSSPHFSSAASAPSLLRTESDEVATARVPAPRARGEFGAQAENARRENALSNSRAARTVAGRAVDAQDCRLLLNMLGLDATKSSGSDD